MTTEVRREPANPLPDGALKMWRWEALIFGFVLFAIAAGIAMGVGALMPWLPLAAVAVGVPYAIVVPRERHRRWRWALHEQELDIVYGIWEVTRTIVPITRIQHVSVQRTGWTDTLRPRAPARPHRCGDDDDSRPHARSGRRRARPDPGAPADAR